VWLSAASVAVRGLRGKRIEDGQTRTLRSLAGRVSRLFSCARNSSVNRGVMEQSTFASARHIRDPIVPCMLRGLKACVNCDGMPRRQWLKNQVLRRQRAADSGLQGEIRDGKLDNFYRHTDESYRSTCGQAFDSMAASNIETHRSLGDRSVVRVYEEHTQRPDTHQATALITPLTGY
jgi:hypothetical protein